MSPRAFVFTISAILIVSYVANVLVAHSHGYIKSSDHLRVLIRFSLECLLIVGLVLAWRPVRWIVIVLAIPMGLLFICMSVVFFKADLTYIPAKYVMGIPMLIEGLAYAGCGIALLMPLAGRHFAKTAKAEQPSEGGMD